MWGFNIKSQSWDHYDMSDNVRLRPGSGAYAEARDQHRSFYLNGQVDYGSSTQTMTLSPKTKISQKGMIIIEHSSNTARNISTDALVGNKPRTRGRMQYISSWGTHGVIVLVGGNEKAVTDTADESLGDLRPMDRVNIFDVASIYDDRVATGGSWYEQPATGDIPERRVDFCIVLARAADFTTANIYMYGGRGANNTFFDDIYVLAIPSFTWTKVYQGNSGRYGHSCHRAGTRTMLSVGGAPTTNLSTGPCDWQTKGINVLDLSTLTWSSQYTMTTEDYAVPKAVTARIGGNAQGNATMMAPAEGFIDAALARVFGSDSVAASNTSHTASSPAERSLLSPTQRAIIAGSTVGGAVLLGLLVAALWFFRGNLHRLVIGDLNERLEMEGQGRNISELPNKGVFWELPGTAPAELWTPTTMVGDTETENFKHETQSDRNLGWRGEVECIGDLPETEKAMEREKIETITSTLTELRSKELD
ncbi:MAG: hypothetical protein Q9220_001359 [cf. Caloplaca sp. 1 TL-2023]